MIDSAFMNNKTNHCRVAGCVGQEGATTEGTGKQSAAVPINYRRPQVPASKAPPYIVN